MKIVWVSVLSVSREDIASLIWQLISLPGLNFEGYATLQNIHTVVKTPPFLETTIDPDGGEERLAASAVVVSQNKKKSRIIVWF